jgi:TM2 domain-containing membrane protein YozV
MASEWFYSHDGERHGPVPVEQIKDMAAGGQLRPDDLVWQAGMETWQPARKVPGLLPPASMPPPIPVGGPPPDSRGNFDPAYAPPPGMADIQNKKLAAGLCGIFLGAFGVHKFILGITTPAVIMLVVSLLGALGGFFCFPLVSYAVMHIIGLIEGIIYLTRSDEEFYQTYMVGKKEWF